MKNTFLVILATVAISCGETNKKETAATNSIVKEQPQDPLAESVKRGREVYSELCVTCHLPNGKGVPGAFPPLNPSNWLTEKRTESIHAVKYGLKGEIEVNGESYNSVMLPLGLDDEEIADVMNYTIQTWNKGDIVTVEEVAAIEE
ncbi:c-type cytochrome [Nonlabens sp. Hel1_33_55]|uniref:c-type cytochrome n=1 Tax=Nonlabens sp. Hel1_33_55 TaxID=1336802 RepID=UPI000B803C64|nr:c-type cytochrome [Nonlabens sp. Hel1_33_55]